MPVLVLETKWKAKEIVSLAFKVTLFAHSNECSSAQLYTLAESILTYLQLRAYLPHVDIRIEIGNINQGMKE